MIAILVSLCAFALPPSAARAPDVKPASAEAARAKLAVAELDKALKSSSKDQKLKAIQEHGGVSDPDVARLLGKGARDKEPDIQGASIQALRWLGQPEALKELHAVVRSEKALRKDAIAYAKLLQAIGQYGDASSIALLADDFGSVPEYVVVQARILGLGRIRSVAAVETLMDLMKAAGAQRMQNLMPDFRLALVRLTGVDKGQSQLLWQEWWNAERVKLRIEPNAPELVRELQAKWDDYWGRDMRYERARPRASRGRGDPDRGA
jgi:hypothetical protein